MISKYLKKILTKKSIDFDLFMYCIENEAACSGFKVFSNYERNITQQDIIDCLEAYFNKEWKSEINEDIKNGKTEIEAKLDIIDVLTDDMIFTALDGEKQDIRTVKVQISKAGGNASKNAVNTSIRLPKTWIIDYMGISQEDREVELTLSNKKIIIRKKEN